MRTGRPDDLLRHRRARRIADAILFGLAGLLVVDGVVRGRWEPLVAGTVALALRLLRPRLAELVVARLGEETLELEGATESYAIARADLVRVGFGNGSQSKLGAWAIRWAKDFDLPVATNAGRSRFVVVDVHASERSRGIARFAVPTGTADEADAFAAEVERWAGLRAGG